MATAISNHGAEAPKTLATYWSNHVFSLIIVIAAVTTFIVGLGGWVAELKNPALAPAAYAFGWLIITIWGIWASGVSIYQGMSGEATAKSDTLIRMVAFVSFLLLGLWRAYVWVWELGGSIDAVEIATSISLLIFYVLVYWMRNGARPSWLRMPRVNIRRKRRPKA